MLVVQMAWLGSSDRSEREDATKGFVQHRISEAFQDFWPDHPLIYQNCRQRSWSTWFLLLHIAGLYGTEVKLTRCIPHVSQMVLEEY